MEDLKRVLGVEIADLRAKCRKIRGFFGTTLEPKGKGEGSFRDQRFSILRRITLNTSKVVEKALIQSETIIKISLQIYL